ncbi:MAG TPA: CAP domain-containing protein [Thermoanaerobaculia bacterium]|nr:CAP domain-containing protein [Thermoanaerobaculia bacterium]
MAAAALAAVPAVGAAALPPDLVTLLEELNRERAAHDLPALLLDDRLSRVAQERAERAAAAASVASQPRQVAEVSRRLLASGYQAFRWSERLMMGSPDPSRLLAEWRRQDPAGYTATVLGDFESVGVGRAGESRTPVYDLLVALPRLTQQRREAAPLAALEAVRALILSEVNQLRAAAGRPPLRLAPRLDEVAQAHATDMLDRGYYDHLGPDGGTVLARARSGRYAPRWIAENIAKGMFTPREVVDRWRQSSGHRRNMLHRDAREMGIGVAFGENANGFEVLWVMVLADEG